jgi:hypothetical protein
LLNIAMLAAVSMGPVLTAMRLRGGVEDFRG